MGTSLVEYEAELVRVHLNPHRGDPPTEELLDFCLKSTKEKKEESLWEKEGKPTVKTLYAIRGCRNLAEPFPFTHLIKISDEMPIDENYHRGYTIVHAAPVSAEKDQEVYPEEVSGDQRYYEGAVRQRTVNAYERIRVARDKCVDHYGLDCAVCGFNFEKFYGLTGKGFIHVHHLKPLAEVDEAYRVDPIEDLRPVCPNCHSMLHQSSPPYTIEELRALLESRNE